MFTDVTSTAIDLPSVRVVNYDGVVDRVAVTRQPGNIPRLDLDRLSESLGQIEVVRARNCFILYIAKASAYARQVLKCCHSPLL